MLCHCSKGLAGCIVLLLSYEGSKAVGGERGQHRVSRTNFCLFFNLLVTYKVYSKDHESPLSFGYASRVMH